MLKAMRIAGILLLVATSAWAQAWRGSGRVAGKVMDEAKKPIEGVTVKVALPAANGEVTVKTNKKGDWSVGGICTGNWQIDFTKAGYEPRNISSPVQAMTPGPPIEIVLKKAIDPNEVIAADLKVAADLITEKKYVEARSVYDALLARFPTAYQIEQFVARTYYLEGQPAKAIERLQGVLARVPDALEVRLLLGSLLLEAGRADEGRQVLAAVDDSKITDASLYVNFGIAMMNKNQAAEALNYFEKAVTRFPQSPDAYYYRGITYLQLDGADATAEQRAEHTAKAKTDLQRFIELAPAAAEAESAKKILEQLK
jgi:tetratricopeptide (TPR) repeat protein